MSNTEAMRKAFEADVIKELANIFDYSRMFERDLTGKYLSYTLQKRWDSWQAATALATAAERERLTPKKVMISDARDYLNTNDKACWVIGWNECVEAIRKGEALEGEQ